MAGIFALGIQTSNGLPRTPALSFLTDSTTGIFLNTANSGMQSVGISSSGTPVALFDTNTVELLSTLKIASGASNNASLASDASGNASWRITNTSGTFKWNMLYKNLNAQIKNNEAPIVFADKLDTLPSVALCRESQYPVDNLDLYIKDKSNKGFKIYSNTFMFKSIISAEIGDYSVIRLTNKCIAICYYNVTIDRMCYIYSLDPEFTSFSTPIIIDTNSVVSICSMTLVGDKPAIAYIADNDAIDEWRYIIATDAIGSAWSKPVIIASSTEDLVFLPLGLFLRVIAGIPTIFFNLENGKAVLVKANDATGISWGALQNISNLTAHEILNIKIIQGNPAILAKSNVTNNVYYVRSLDDAGLRWPVGATQIYKANNVALETNIGKCCNAISVVDNVICIIASEISTNSLYISKAKDIYGNAFTPYTLLCTTNTSSPFPRIFVNNGKSVLIYNNATGTPSEKNIIEFINAVPGVPKNLVKSLSFCGDHQVLPNVKDNNNIMVIVSAGCLSLLKYFNSDLSINWTASC